MNDRQRAILYTLQQRQDRDYIPEGWFQTNFARHDIPLVRDFLRWRVKCDLKKLTEEGRLEVRSDSARGEGDHLSLPWHQAGFGWGRKYRLNKNWQEPMDIDQIK